MDLVSNVIVSLLPKIVDASKKNMVCEACRIEDGSQKHHICVPMASDTEREYVFNEALKKCNDALIAMVFRVNGRAMPPVDVNDVKECNGEEIKQKFMRDELGSVESENLVLNLISVVKCLFQ